MIGNLGFRKPLFSVLQDPNIFRDAKDVKEITIWIGNFF